MSYHSQTVSQQICTIGYGEGQWTGNPELNFVVNRYSCDGTHGCAATRQDGQQQETQARKVVYVNSKPSHLWICGTGHKQFGRPKGMQAWAMWSRLLRHIGHWRSRTWVTRSQDVATGSIPTTRIIT
jgi:hypothetical protein